MAYKIPVITVIQKKQVLLIDVVIQGDSIDQKEVKKSLSTKT